MKNNECFDCLNHGEGVFAENTGWYHFCKCGIENESLQDIETCEKYEPNMGFQVGGYYTHMHFKGGESGCLEWYIHGDGEFPKDNPKEWMQLHLCDFKQVEKWVKFWGGILRERGWIVED